MEAAKEQDNATHAEEAAMITEEAAAHVLEDGEHEEEAKLEEKEEEEVKEVAPVMTDIEKKKQRAARFGTDLNISEAEKRRLRAARFNDGTKKTTPVAAPPVETEVVKVPESVKAALMETESLKRKARAERFGSLQPEAVLKPKFASKDDSVAAPKANKLPDDEEAKKKARMARFAMTAK